MGASRRRCGRIPLAAWLLAATGALAQDVVRNDERLGASRPEAWAMNYVAAATLHTPFGGTPTIAPWRWEAAMDLRQIPRLDDDQQRVGFAGTKQEDLNKSPAFGRVRAMLGLPGGFVADLGYTPPLTIDGTRARDLFSAAIGRRVVDGDRFTLSLRAFGQHGRAGGDITCPAGRTEADLETNPFGCNAASDDRIRLNAYGADASGAWRFGDWGLHATAGVARTELEVQVDALTFGVRDRSRLVARDWKPWFALGGRYDLDRCWTLAAELLHVPLRVRREGNGGRETDPFTGAGLQLRYRFE